jgi:antitoxin HigA-1
LPSVVEHGTAKSTGPDRRRETPANLVTIVTVSRVSIHALSREIAVPPNCISEIVSGKRVIISDTALRLGKYFGVSSEIWLTLQADYDLRATRRSTWPKIEPRVRAYYPSSENRKQIADSIPRLVWKKSYGKDSARCARAPT